MLEKVRSMLKGEDTSKLKRAPFHVALTMHGIKKWSDEASSTYDQAYSKSFEKLKELIEVQVDEKIRIFSIYIIPETMKDSVDAIDHFIEFVNGLKHSDIVNKNQIKVSVLGKWYDLPNRAIDPIKELITETKDYDNFFLNLCINYNGQEEIVGAMRVIARKILAEKIDPENIDKEMIKDNIYTSYFLPPDILIKTGVKRRTFGFLLWDSPKAHIHFVDKLFPEMTKHDFHKALKEWEKYKEYVYK